MTVALKIEVREIEPNWLIVHFEGNRPPNHHRYRLLDHSLHDWLAKHPKRILQRVSPIEHNGQLVGLLAWHADERGARQMGLQVGKTLVDAHGREYLEALLEEIARFLDTHPPSPHTLAIVNRRGIVTLVDSDRDHGIMMPLDRFLTHASQKGREQIDRFLADPKSTLLAVEVGTQFQAPDSHD